MLKRIVCLFLTAVMLVSACFLGACSPKTSLVDAKPAKGALTTKSLTNVYQAQAVSTLDTVFEKMEIHQIKHLKDNSILIAGYDTETYDNKYYITDIDLKNAKELSINKSEDANTESYVNNVIVDAENEVIWYTKNVYSYTEYPVANDDMLIGMSKPMMSYAGEITVMPEVYPATYGESKEEFYLVKADFNGNIINETEISNIISITDEAGNTYKGYIGNMLSADGNLVMAIDGRKLIVVDSESLEIQKEGEIDTNYIEKMFKDDSGNVYFTSWGENGYVAMKIDLTTFELTPADLIFAENVYAYGISQGQLGYDFLASNETALYGYNIGDAELTEICNYANSDINMSYSTNVPAVLPDGRLMVSFYDYESSVNEVLLLRKLEPSEIKEKYVITVAGPYIDGEIKKEFIKFNRVSEDYKIVFKDYSQYNNEANEWRGAYDKLTEDILSKDKAPDIIMLDAYGMDIDGLVAKGALADLNKFMDSDDEFNREDYLNNVFEALETNGGLYMITPVVNFRTLAGKKSIFGDRTGWTMKEFLEMHNSLGEDERMFTEATRDGIGKQLLSICVDQFIAEDGRCTFNSEEFKSILSYIKDIPEDYRAYEDEWSNNKNYWYEMEASYSKGTTKLYQSYIYNFNIIPELEAYLGEEVTFIGYPTADGENGTFILPSTLLAIGANSKVPAGAWEAIKRILSDEYQNRFSGDRNEDGSGGRSYQFPLNKNIIKKRMVNDILPYYYTYTDENGETVKEEYNNTYWIADAEVTLRKSTEEDVERLLEVLSGASVVYTDNSKIIDIIMQDAAAYFNGEKSADEVANIINSRIQIYVSERM